MLGGVHTLNLSGCDGITDVSALGGVHTLDLSDCSGITDVYALEELSLFSAESIQNATQQITNQYNDMVLSVETSVETFRKNIPDSIIRKTIENEQQLATKYNETIESLKSFIESERDILINSTSTQLTQIMKSEYNLLELNFSRRLNETDDIVEYSLNFNKSFNQLLTNITSVLTNLIIYETEMLRDETFSKILEVENEMAHREAKNEHMFQ